MTSKEIDRFRLLESTVHSLDLTVTNLKHTVWNLASAVEHAHKKIRDLEKQNVERNPKPITRELAPMF